MNQGIFSSESRQIARIVEKSKSWEYAQLAPFAGFLFFSLMYGRMQKIHMANGPMRREITATANKNMDIFKIIYCLLCHMGKRTVAHKNARETVSGFLDAADFVLVFPHIDNCTVFSGFLCGENHQMTFEGIPYWGEED